MYCRLSVWRQSTKPPGVSLFYNDYDTFLPEKREAICETILKPLLAEKLVDGMGMQSHLQLAAPSADEYRTAVRRYGALGLQVQITELDVFSPRHLRRSDAAPCGALP